MNIYYDKHVDNRATSSESSKSLRVRLLPRLDSIYSTKTIKFIFNVSVDISFRHVEDHKADESPEEIAYVRGQMTRVRVPGPNRPGNARAPAPLVTVDSRHRLCHTPSTVNDHDAPTTTCRCQERGWLVIVNSQFHHPLPFQHTIPVIFVELLHQ